MGTVVRDTILILETARKMGWDDVSWVGNNAAYNQAVADRESGAAEGYYAFVHMAMIYRDNPRSEEVAAWWDKFVDKYGRNPESRPDRRFPDRRSRGDTRLRGYIRISSVIRAR